MSIFYFLIFTLIFLVIKLASKFIKNEEVSSALNFFATPLIVISLLPLIWFGIYLGPTVPLMLIIFALTLSVVGDVYNSMPNNSHFIWGLVYFAIAHIFYVIAFISIINFSWIVFWTLLPVAIEIIILLTFFYMKWRKRLDKIMAIAVPCYMIIVGFIMLITIGVHIGNPGNGTFMLMLGGILFFASDLTIGISTFGCKTPTTELATKLAGFIVWITYVAAQVLFAVAAATGLFSK